VCVGVCVCVCVWGELTHQVWEEHSGSLGGSASRLSIL
jgi:hypothetical protein